MTARQGLMWEAGERGNIRLRGCELREYARMKDFIRDHPGCTGTMIKSFMGTWRVGMFLAYGANNGDLRGDMGHPERWWLNEHAR